MNITVPTTAQIAHSLERGARIAAPAIALIITSVVLLVELAYELGRFTGQAVHDRNDQLAAIWRNLWAAEPEALAEPAVAPIPASFAPVAPPIVHTLALLAVQLEGCTADELRRVTGSRRRCSKAELVAAYVAA